MRIVSWNCNGAFRKKFKALDKFNADICIIQECENPEFSKDKDYLEFSKNYLWVGENKNKGLGIFAKQNIILNNNNWDSDVLKFFISCKINHDFDLLGVWAHGANSPTFGYIGQFWKYLQIHKKKMKNIIIGGDFNSNVKWDKWDRWWNHSDVIRELEEINIVSFYHKHFNIEQGKEKIPTLFHRKNKETNYHIDYFLGNKKYLSNIKKLNYGKFSDWLDKSDHIPILLELDL